MNKETFTQKVNDFSQCLIDYFTIKPVEFEQMDSEDQDDWMACVTADADPWEFQWTLLLSIHTEDPDRIGISIEDGESLNADFQDAMTYLAMEAIAQLRTEYEKVDRLESVLKNTKVTLAGAIEDFKKVKIENVMLKDAALGTPCEQIRHGQEMEEMRERIERLRLQKAQREAHDSVLIQGLATLARRNPELQQFAEGILKAADEAFKRVKLSDLVTVHLNQPAERDRRGRA